MIRAKSKKRMHERFKLEMPIMYALSKGNRYCYYGGKIFNCSDGGLYFETDYELPRGTFLNIKKVSRSPHTCDLETEDTQRMSVKWCKKYDVEGRSYYGVGVGYNQEAGGEEAKTISSVTETIVDTLFKPADHSKKRLKQSKENAEKKAARLEKLYRLITQVTSNLDLQEVLQSICKEMLQIFASRNVGIGLLNEERSRIKVVAFYSKDAQESDATGLELDLHENIATLYVIQNGQAIVVPDVQNNPLTESYHDIAVSRGSHSLMIVPLKTKHRVIGTIGLPRSRSFPLFTDEEVLMAQEIADKIALAIENAQIHAETEKAKRSAEHELEIGRKIQAGFLPEKMPIPAGWEIVSHLQAARYVSGDFYDVFRLENERRIAIAIGDVCDKGVGAALFMALFRSLIRAFSIQQYTDSLSSKYAYRSAEKIIRKTINLTNNYIVSTHGRASMFATLFFGIIDPESGRMVYANCGHEAPFVIGESRIKAELYPTGLSAGVFSDISFTTKQIQIEPGDILFAYTDGLIDAQNASGDFYTRPSLIDAITGPYDSLNDLIDRITKQINRFLSGTQQYDDITILAVRRLVQVS